MAIHRACAAHAQQAQAPQAAAAPRTEYHFAFTPDEVNVLADIPNSARLTMLRIEPLQRFMQPVRDQNQPAHAMQGPPQAQASPKQ
jgi:hypothetical protein